MKAVLMSIQPKWCRLIANGKKTVEVRKTRPKLDTPFKCYIYCTKSNKEFLQSRNNVLFYCEDRDFIGGHGVGIYKRLNGKVIVEFVCNKILFANGTNFIVKEDAETTLQGTCLTKNDIYKYLGIKSGMSRYDKKTEFYRWHISDLVIYDKPKELNEFHRHDDAYDNAFGYAFEDRVKSIPLKRPPQSWCYVEGKEDESNEII